MPASMSGPVDGSASDGRMSEAERDAVLRLARRVEREALSAKPDPARPDEMILMRRSGGMTLGAGRAPAARLRAALALLGSAAASPTPPDGSTAPPAPPRVNERESPLAWLRRRRGPDGQPLISDRAFQAGERFRCDVTRAGMLPSVTVDWSRVEAASGERRGFDPAAASDATLAARQRVRFACRNLGAAMAHLLIDVCAFLVPIEEVERRRRWPSRSGKVVLRLALEQLADHYGIQTQAQGRDRSGIESWMGEDARPGLDHWLDAS